MKNQESPARENTSRRRGYTPRHLKAEPVQKKRKVQNPRRIIFFALLTLCCVSAIGLGICFCMFSNENRQLEELADMVSQNIDILEYNPTDPESPTDSTDSTEPAAPIEPDSVTEPTTPAPPQMLPQYIQLYEQNSDLFGWLQIEDTRINYPVMHTPEDPEKYLLSNFSNKFSYNGLPFLDADCTAQSDNMLIYGHNMPDGSMFRELTKYKDSKYWEQHPIIKLDTLYEQHEYEVMAVFQDRVYRTYDQVFKFYQFIDADSEEEFDTAITYFKNKQLYETNVDAQYGDQLLTLVTCDYHTDNGRFVLVARRIS